LQRAASANRCALSEGLDRIARAVWSEHFTSRRIGARDDEECTFTAYVGFVAFMRSKTLTGGESALITTMPVNNLLEILVAMPIATAVIAWLLGGREPRALTHQVIE